MSPEAPTSSIPVAGLAPPAAPPPTVRDPDPRLVAAIVASALFMQNLDGTVVATALPAMARDFGESPLRMGGAITAYLVALTVFIPVSGWVADRFGARRVFLAAIVVFTGASVLCGAATTLPFLIASRVLQGVGGAMMVPVGRLLLYRRVRKDQLLSATAWLSVPGLIGPIMGPPLGGFLTDALSWRAVFDINIPVGIVGIAAVLRFIPEVERTDPGRLDLTGLLLTGGALALLMFGIETAGRGILPDYAPEAAMLAGCLAGWLAWRHCRRVDHPAVDLTLLRIPSFHAAAVAGSVFRMGAGATPFLVPLTLQLGFGKSASQSGLIAFATALGAISMKPIAQRALRAYGFRNVVIWNGVIAAALVGVIGAIRPGWSLAAIFLLLLLGGLGRSLQFTAFNTLAFADVPQPRLSAATSLYGTLQQLPQALGVAMAAAVLEASVAWSGGTGPTMPDFTVAFVVAGLVAVLAAPMAARLPRDAGDEVSGHRDRA